jgi:hypothetical protein
MKLLIKVSQMPRWPVEVVCSSAPSHVIRARSLEGPNSHQSRSYLHQVLALQGLEDSLALYTDEVVA